MGHAGAVAHAGKTLGDALEGAARVVHQLPARLGQAHAAGRAPHEGHARGALQLGNVLAHGRLADAQPRRCAGVAALLAQHHQPVQVRPEGFGWGVVWRFHGAIVHQCEQSFHGCGLGAAGCGF